MVCERSKHVEAEFTALPETIDHSDKGWIIFKCLAQVYFKSGASFAIQFGCHGTIEHVLNYLVDGFGCGNTAGFEVSANTINNTDLLRRLS